MRIEWLNDGNPFPKGHAKAGFIGKIIDFEDGFSDPQRVYAQDKDSMIEKLSTMYGNTRNTVIEQKRLSKTPPPPPPEITPVTTIPSVSAGMTPDERMQTVADLDDPAKAATAAAKLVAEGSGFDFNQAKRDQDEAKKKKTAEEHKEYMAGEITKFMDENPEYVGTENNAKLLRDRTFARVGPRPTAADWTQSYQELDGMGVLESAAASEEPTATVRKEPSAPPPVPPRVTTGARPSQLQRGPQRVIAAPQWTRSEALDLAESDDYDERIQREPGFREKIEAALNNPG